MPNSLLVDLYPWVTRALGGFIGAALLIPTKLGEALIKFRCDKNLEGFKSQQIRDLEALKEQLNHLSDRGKRSNRFGATPKQAGCKL